MKAVLADTGETLANASSALDGVRRLTGIALILPIPLVFMAIFVIGHYKENWWRDPFILSILAVFIAGQLLAVWQYVRILRGARRSAGVVVAMQKHGEESPSTLLERLRALRPGHLRDVLVRTLESGLRGDNSGFLSILDNASYRRSSRESKILGLHISMNRTTLKLGFLGTLIGLLWTFPPMKDAILALRNSDGEMQFVTDIARAIDGDYYAIYTTLIATGLSIFIEIITIQLLERILGRFEMVNSYMDEYNMAVLQPAIRLHLQGDGSDLRGAALQLVRQLGDLHEQAARNLETVMEAVQRSTQRLEETLRVQEVLDRRVGRLLEYEKDYRTFLGSKSEAAGPHGTQPAGESSRA